MAGHQVNARLTPEQDVDFNIWATELGVERGKLAKDIIGEALEARREGRASFDRPEPLAPADLSTMKAMLERGLMEIERIAGDWAAHASRMHKQEREDQLALSRARAEFIAGIPDRILASLNPIKAEMAAMAERIDKQPRLDEIDRRLCEHTEALRANTAAIERVEKQPRKVTGIIVGDGGVWSTTFVLSCGVALMLLGWIALLPVFWATPLGIPMASKLLPDDAAFCQLVDRRYGATNCRDWTMLQADRKEAPARLGKKARKP